MTSESNVKLFKSVGPELYTCQPKNLDDILVLSNDPRVVRLAGHEFIARPDNSPIFAFDGQIYNVSDIDKLPVKHFVDDQLDVEIHETNTATFIIDAVMFEYFVKVAVDKSQLTTGYQFTRLLSRIIWLLFESYYH